MEGSEREAALGLNPQLFLNEVLNSVDDVLDGAFHFCLQQAPEIVGAGAASKKAEELERGVSSLHHFVKAVLDKRMDNWEKYCLRHCFTVPEGFMIPKDDNSSAQDLLHKEWHSDSELDAELDSLRRKLASADKESEELQKEISSLERHTKFSSNFDASVAEVLKLFEENSVQENFQDIVKAIPKLHQKMLEMKRKRAESMVNQKVGNMNSLREYKRAALDKGFTGRIADIQEFINVSRQD